MILQVRHGSDQQSGSGSHDKGWICVYAEGRPLGITAGLDVGVWEQGTKGDWLQWSSCLLRWRGHSSRGFDKGGDTWAGITGCLVGGGVSSAGCTHLVFPPWYPGSLPRTHCSSKWCNSPILGWRWTVHGVSQASGFHARRMTLPWWRSCHWGKNKRQKVFGGCWCFQAGKPSACAEWRMLALAP